MANTVYLVIASAAVMWALWRSRDVIAGTLALGLAASVAVPLAGPQHLLPLLSAIDAFACLVMMVVWIQYTSLRAWAVGYIGLVKTGLTFLAAWGLLGPWAYALPFDAAFLAQVAVAGGLADDLGARIDDVRRRVLPRGLVLLRDGEG
ncbi:hypothetical protein [Novosphingobium sp.]|uniref:hypothetical protein n=1 Tax=Novosphingobium sp. TaxID=1874826 RepID=UPI0038B85BBE